MGPRFATLAPACLVLLAAPLPALDGELDPSFGSSGQVVFGVGVGPAHARDAVAVEGGVVAVGDDEANPGNFDFLAVRLDEAGIPVGTSGPIPKSRPMGFCSTTRSSSSWNPYFTRYFLSPSFWNGFTIANTLPPTFHTCEPPHCMT